MEPPRNFYCFVAILLFGIPLSHGVTPSSRCSKTYVAVLKSILDFENLKNLEIDRTTYNLRTIPQMDKLSSAELIATQDSQIASWAKQLPSGKNLRYRGLSLSAAH